MRIVYLTNQYPKASHSFVRRELLEIEKLGHEVMRWSVRPPADDLRDEQDLAEREKTNVLLNQGMSAMLVKMKLAGLKELCTAPIRTLKTYTAAFKLGLGSHRGLIKYLIYFGEACLLKTQWQADNVDHVHVHFGTNPAAVAMFCRMLGGPTYSVTVHGPEEFVQPEGWRLASKVKHSNFAVVISRKAQRDLQDHVAPADRDKIKLVHCGVDNRFLTFEAQPVPDAMRFVCVGRLCEDKNQPVLIDAVKALKDEAAASDNNTFKAAVEQLKIVFVGDGDLRDIMEQKVEQFGLQDHINMIGWASAERVQEELLAARCMVLPSLAEGLPVVIMEAFAMGRPVISTPVNGIPELVKPQGNPDHMEPNGWLAEAGDVTTLAEAIKAAMLMSTHELDAYAARGREVVYSDFNCATEANKLLEHIQNTKP